MKAEQVFLDRLVYPEFRVWHNKRYGESAPLHHIVWAREHQNSEDEHRRRKAEFILEKEAAEAKAKAKANTQARTS
jgi:hypothetical protein